MQYDLSFDMALQRMEQRMTALEARAQPVDAIGRTAPPQSQEPPAMLRAGEGGS